MADGLIEAVHDPSDAGGDGLVHLLDAAGTGVAGTGVAGTGVAGTGVAGTGLVHLPDTVTSLIFRRTTAGRADLLVVGPRTRAAYFTGKDVPVCVGARLRPGVARAALGPPVTELVDRVVPLADLWGADASRLERRLSDLGDDRDLIGKHLETALGAKVAGRSPHEARLVRAAARELASARPARMPDLARRLAVSERHLRTLFTDASGLPPKAFARIARLRSALADQRRPKSDDLHPSHPVGAGRDGGRVGEASADGGGLAELAVTSGYYDQAHMSAEFRSLLGVPPGAFFAGRLPAPSPCHGTPSPAVR